MAKKEYKPTAVEFLEVEGNLFAQTTKKDDLITITSDLDKPVFVKASKGTDSISFEGINTVADLQDRSKITFKHVAGTKNLEIDLLNNNDGSVKQTVTIENYFKKVDGKATASSIKNVQLTDGGVTKYVAILDQALIDYDQVIVATKKKATGTAFNDVISGSTQNDTIKGNGGNDIIDAGTGNDKIYGGKGADTFVFGTYQLGGKFYGSGVDTIYDAEDIDTFKFETSNVEELKFEQVKKDLKITYIDKNDETGATTENVVTVKNYYDKNGARVKDFQISALDEYGNLDTWESVETVRSDDFKKDMAAKRAIQETAAAAAEAERARKAAEYDQVAQDLADTQEELATTQGVLEQTEANLETATENYNTAKTNYETTKAAFEAYEEEHLKTNAEYQAMSDAKDEAQANFEEAQANYEAKAADLDAYTASHTYNNTEYALLEQQKDTAAANYETAQANYEAKAQALAAYEATHQHDNVAYNNLVQAKEQAEADFTAYAANHSKTDAEYQAKEAALADATQALADYEESHSHDDTEWSNLVQEKDTATTNYNTAKANYEQAQADLTAYTASHTYDNTQYALLEQQKDTATANYNTAKANYEQAQADLTAYTATHQYDNVAYNNLVQQKALADQALTDYKSNHNNTDAAYTALEQAKAAADAALTAYEDSHSHDDTEWGELLAAKNTAQQNYETAQQNYETTKDAYEAYQETHSKTNEEYQAKVDALAQAESDLETANSEKAAAENALEVYTANHSRTNEEYQAMSDAKDAAELARDAAITDKETAETALTNYQNTHTHDNTEWTALTTEKNTAVANYEAAQANLLAKVSELATYEANHLKTNAEYQALEQAKADADQALTDYKANHNNTDAQYQALEQAKADADQALIDYKEDYAHSNTEYQAKVDAVTAAEGERDAAIADKATAEAALTAYQANHSNTDEAYDAKVAELAQAQADLATAQAGKTAAETALTAYQANHSKTDSEYATLAEQKADALADLAAAQATVTTLTGEKAALENQVGTLTTEKAALQDQLDAIAAGAKDYSGFDEDKTIPATKTSEYDKLVFANSKFTNCEFNRDGYDLVITYYDDKNGTDESANLTLKDYFAPTTTNKIDTFVDKDGNTHSITDALNGATIVVGTVDNDEFNPTTNEEIFVLNGGNDVFNSADSEDKVAGDKVQLTTGTKQTDVSYSRTFGSDDLVINYSDEDSVKMKGYFAEDKYSPKTIVSDDAEFDIAADLETKGITVNGTDNADTFTPTDLKETFVVSNGDYIKGGITAEDQVNTAGDKIKLDGYKSLLKYSRGETDANDLVITYSSGKSVTIEKYFGAMDGEYFSSMSYYPSKVIDKSNEEFDLKTDVLEKGLTVTGTGSSNLTPTEMKETFVVSSGDTIAGSESSTNVEGDKIKITGSKNDVYYTQAGEYNLDLVIHYDSDKSVTLSGYFPSYGYEPLNLPGRVKTDYMLEEFDLATDVAEKGITFAGTSGADYFTPTANKDNFIINGNDTIYASSDAYPTDATTDDVIQLTCSKSDITYEKNGADLIINYGTGKKLTLENFYDEEHDDDPSGAKTMTVVTSNATFSLIDDLKDRGVTQKGTSGNDTYSPSEFKDLIELAGGDDSYAGSSGVSYAESKLSDDVIKIDCDKDDITYDAGSEGSLIIKYPGGTLTINRYFDDDTTEKDHGASTLTIVTNDNTGFSVAEDLADKGIVHQGTGGDTFNASEAKDVIILAGGDNSYLGGSDKSYAESKLAEDTITINCDKENITYELGDEDSLIIKYPSGTLKISKYFQDGGASSITLITNDNSGFTIGSDLAEKGVIIDTDETTFEPSSLKETFVVKDGDTISYSGTAGYTAGDKINIKDNDRSDISYTRSTEEPNDLVINFCGSVGYDHITLSDYFVNGKYHPDIIKTDDAEFYLAADLEVKGFTKTGTSPNYTFTPTADKETFVVGNGDTIAYTSSAGYAAGDKIQLEGTRDNVSYNISTTDSDDLVITFDSGKKVTIDDYFSSGKYHPETIKIGAEEFNLDADFETKGITLVGTGSSSFTPTSAKETFVVSSGDSFNGLYQKPLSYTINDTIELDGSQNGVTYTRSASSSDLVVNYGSDKHITMNSYFGGSTYYYPETLKAGGEEFNLTADVASKGITVTGTNGSDTFSITKAKETFEVGNGDTISYSSSAGYTDGDKIQLTGDRSDVSYSRSSNDLVVTYDSDDKSVTISGYFNSSYYHVEKLITTGDSKEFYIDVDMMKKGLTVNGTNENDSFSPTEFEETFVPNGGNDTFAWETSDNVAGDKIKLSGNKADVTYARSGDNLVITYAGGTVKLNDYANKGADCFPATIITDDDSTGFDLAADMADKGLTGGGSFASNNRIATLSFDAAAWQSAGADSGMTDVAMNNPDEVNLMQIYTNNA